MGMAVLMDAIIDVTQLTRTELCLLICWVPSQAFFLIRAGRWFDVHGARGALITASLMPSMSILFLSMVDRASEYAAPLIGING